MEKEITIKDIKKMALFIHKMKTKPLPKRISWISKIMNRFGWHRKYEIIILDREQFNYFPKSFNQPIKIKDKDEK